MNIFVLSEDPAEAAQMQCDKHVVKMILESGQMLCAAHEPGIAPWKRTHYNHPCTIWARTTKSNYRWLAVHGLELCAEYTRRYKKRHASEDVLMWCAKNIPESIPEGALTPFVVAIKNPNYHKENVVNSYREYYLKDKIRFAKWNYCNPPKWWTDNFCEPQADSL